ncbi:hypothetical protein AB4865_03505 [Capnocytophaga sp. ARDL2]|uniref:hypothetical protein n=1 Tax=Capnocytophaga sp. ARDL2 TaxID=3238809 RepID=UPI003555EDE3
MKVNKVKRIVILLFVLIGFLQSCTVNAEYVFHKDETSTVTLEVEVKEDSEGNLVSKDSVKSKFPKEWTSVYDMNKVEGEVIPPDSEEIAKRTFVKGIYKDEKKIGFGIRLERLSNEDWKKIEKSQKKEEKLLSSLNQSSIEWSDKKLIINLEELLRDDNQTKQKSKNKTKKKEDDFGAQIASSMLEAFDIQLNTKFVFENEIKSIKGKHPNFKQINKHTVQFNINLKEKMEQSSKKKKHDKFIIIETK